AGRSGDRPRFHRRRAGRTRARADSGALAARPAGRRPAVYVSSCPSRRRPRRSHRADGSIAAFPGPRLFVDLPICITDAAAGPAVARPHRRRRQMRDTFRVFATRTSEWVGTPAAFVLGLGLILLRALTGPFFHFSDTWQLVVNTATTIVTFLMVFLIQNTQNRDARAIHLKLDELIRGVKGARTAMVALENATDDELA